MRDVYINSFGAFLPGEPVASSEMELYLGKINSKPSRNRALVLRRNKIKTRYYALDQNGHSKFSSVEMAVKAVEDAIGKSEVVKEDISYLASAATLGDFLVPGFASQIHAGLKIPPIEIASFQSVCASAMMAMKSAYLQIKAGEHDCAAVCASEFASRYFRPEFYEGTKLIRDDGTLSFDADFLRFTLSDGAGAAMLEARPNQRQYSFKIHWIDLRSYADRFEPCMVAGGVEEDGEIKYWGGFGNPAKAMEAGALVLSQDLSMIQRMIPVWVAHYLDLIDQGKIVIDDIDHVCSHYSSHSLREETIRLLKAAGAMIDEEKWFSNLYTKGNTGSASIFIMLEELCRTRELQKGQKIICHVPESGRCINSFMLLEVV